MLRRLAALAGFIAVVALALLLLYRVYLHHTAAEPYDDDEPEIARMAGSSPAAHAAKIYLPRS